MGTNFWVHSIPSFPTYRTSRSIWHLRPCEAPQPPGAGRVGEWISGGSGAWFGKAFFFFFWGGGEGVQLFFFGGGVEGGEGGERVEPFCFCFVFCFWGEGGYQFWLGPMWSRVIQSARRCGLE